MSLSNTISVSSSTKYRTTARTNNSPYSGARNPVHCSGNMSILNREGIYEPNSVLLLATIPSGYDVSNLVRKAIQSGASVNERDVNGDTPLHHAVRYSAKLVHTLVKFGADVRAINKYGEAPIHSCTISLPFDMVGALTPEKSIANGTDRHGLTPFHNAIVNGDMQMCHSLLNCGSCPVKRTAISNLSPLRLLVSSPLNLRRLDELIPPRMLTEEDVNDTCFGRGPHLLEDLITNDKLDLTAELLAHPLVNMETKDKNGVKLKSKLHELLNSPYRVENEAKTFCTKPVTNPNEVSSSGLEDTNLLRRAAEADYYKVRHEAGVSSVLLDEVLMDRYDVLDTLLNAGADPNSEVYYGRSVMHIGLVMCSVDKVDVLMRNRGSLTMRDCDGRLPIHYLIAENPFNAVVFYKVWNKMKLERQENYVDKWGLTPLMLAVVHNRYNPFLKMLQDGVDFSSRCVNGDSILHLAVIHEAVPIIEKIISLDKNLLFQSNMVGMTPLKCALEIGNPFIISTLEKHCRL